MCSIRLFLVDTAPFSEDESLSVSEVKALKNFKKTFINPEIIDPNETLSSYEEGCLSVPGVFEEIERPDECTVKFMDKEGIKQKMLCKGMLATVIQHEMDHLNGIVFVDHLSKLKRDRAIKKSIKSRSSETKKNE